MGIGLRRVHALNTRAFALHEMRGLLSRIEENNTLKPEQLGSFTPLSVGGQRLGYVRQEFCSRLLAFPDVFIQFDNTLMFTPKLDRGTSHDRTQALATVTAALRAEGIVRGWRDELVEAVPSFNQPPVFLVERAAYPFFGIRGFGVHVNGFVRNPVDRRVEAIWVGKRASTKSLWPGMLDHIVAGGLSTGFSVTQTVARECDEEASIPGHIAAEAVPVGAVSYMTLDAQQNLKRDSLFCFDLELPADFIPIPRDGEVECFELREVDWVVDAVLRGGPAGYKPNCHLVLIDFFIRHGVIAPESPDYLPLVHALRNAA